MNLTATSGHKELTPTKCKYELTETLCYEAVITSSCHRSPDIRRRHAYHTSSGREERKHSRQEKEQFYSNCTFSLE